MSWIDRQAAISMLVAKHRVPKAEIKEAISVGIARGQIEVSTKGRLDAEALAKLRITKQKENES